MDLEEVKQALDLFNVKITHVYTETSLDPEPGEIVENLPIDRRIKDSLKARGINRLYKFQEEALRKILAGKNVMIISGTGTGKTEAFMIPILEFALKGERSVLVYPTKALARDQLDRIISFAHALGINVGVFDGDTPNSERERLYNNPPSVLITNPDMIHIGLALSHRFRTLLRGAEHFVFDEVHVYEGVLGSHLRMISDRIREFLDYHVIASSATIGASPFLFEELFGVEGEIIQGTNRRKGIAFHVLLNIGSASRWTIGAYLASFLMKKGLKVLVFVDSQQMAEVLAKIIKRFGFDIPVHRAGLNPEERIKVEEDLKEGKIMGVVATPTLELGIDIGDLDAVIMAENPPSYTKYLQRAGRAGRRYKVGYIFTLLGDDPIDSYYNRRPQEFFNRKLTPLPFDISNKEVIKIHVSAYIVEKGRVKISKLPKSWIEVLKDLPVKVNGDYVYSTPELIKLVRSTSLRSTGPIIKIYEGDKKVGERELPVALYDLYPEAIYLISKRTYRVESIDISTLIAKVKRVEEELPFYTKPLYSTHLISFKEIESRKVFNMPVKYGEAEILVSVDGYVVYDIMGKKNKPREERYYKNPITFSYITKGVLIKHPILSEFNEFDAAEAFHATEHVLISSAKITAGASMTDLAGISYPSGHVIIYDAVVGGSGVSKLLYERLEDSYDIALDITGKCDCEDGCPKCIYSPYCGNNNKVLSRKKSFRLISYLKENYSNTDNTDEEIYGNPIA
ncbi:DEAD/DEAH box helicase [Sulfurisphaera javensis]|uniref:DEAD/DEAH box helicase n=1 Tax=Sulfurisphaera javensis TaxID=2049879 RepID=A0AAT9GPA9_9CREN